MSSDFMTAFKSGKTLAQAQDDGFASVERSELVDQPMLLVKWELNPGIGGAPYARVWARVFDPETGEERKVKFADGGRSFDGIPATLKELERNRVKTNVAVYLRGEEYDFEDSDTGEMKTAVRYTFESPSA